MLKSVGEVRVVVSEELLDALVDFAVGVEAAVSKLKRDIYDLVQKANDAKPLWDSSKIFWEKAEGGKGPYEKATAEGNKGNSDFDGLVADLKAHGGRLRRLGYFYWLFELSESPAVGRKLVKRV